MLSLEQCEKILNTNEDKYTREEIKVIREFLYILGEIEYEAIKTVEGDTLCKSIN